MIERSKTLQMMDHLEMVVMKQGWPIPCSPYYLVHHKKLLAALDMLRASLQEEADDRFLQIFNEQFAFEEQEDIRYRATLGKER